MDDAWIVRRGRFLWGYAVCPALMIVVALIAGAPGAGERPDWNGTSFPAHLISMLAFLHFFYGFALVVVLEGRRLVALACGMLSLLPVGIVYICAYWHVTGIYL